MTFIHVPEVPDAGGIVECTPATGLEVVRHAFEGSPDQPPATPAEREALRVAMGVPDNKGASYDQLVHGCLARYGWAPRLLTKLPSSPPAEGEMWGVQGFYPKLPLAFRGLGESPGFGTTHGDGAHSITVRHGPIGCDPLVLAGKGYTGAALPWSAIQAYFAALPGARVVQAFMGEAAHRAGGNVAVMSIYVRSNTPGRFAIAKGSTVNGYSPDGDSWKVSKTLTAGDDTGAPFDFHLALLSGTANPSSLLHCTDGYFAGLYVATSQVVESYDPAPPADRTHTVTLQIDGVTQYTKAV